MSSSPPPDVAQDRLSLRAMTAADIEQAHALSAELRWPHRPTDWEQVFAHAEGTVVEQDGQILGTGLRWRWGTQHASVGLIIVSPAYQGRGIGRQLMHALLDGLEDHSVLLQATEAGRPLYEKLGFDVVGGVRQHQGVVTPTPLIAQPPGWRMRPAGLNELAALQSLDAAARGMPRSALIEDLLASAEACVVLDHEQTPRGFAMLRRFGRGHVIGPVVAPDVEGAKALIAHLAGQNTGHFTRIDVDAAAVLGDWLAAIGLVEVDSPTTMVRGKPLVYPEGAPTLFAITTQAIG
ncbi:MAG: GNAT family N-acetyltransferase [Polaromonas sp.]|uniref:GNAT family N-acetyltransferase n=1 Tax=Polaromonas sp. TaxID=1869339 RepID=UPI0032638F8C